MRTSTSRGRCYEARAAFWKILMWIVPMFVAGAMAIWIYHLTRVTKPVVEMRKDIEHVMKDFEKLTMEYGELERHNKAIERQVVELGTKLECLLDMNKKPNVEIEKPGRIDACPKEQCEHIESPK
jgi:hypothetical protein